MNTPLRRGAVFACASLFAVAVFSRELAAPPPSQIYGELFHRVQTERLFPDSKTFVDATPTMAPAEVMTRYEAQKQRADFSLRKFVDDHFTIPAAVASDFRTTRGEELRVHIDRLWPALTREPRRTSAADSLLRLTTRYVVPGGRFRELYYWDSYFTMLGLQAGGRHDLVADMVQTFAGLIDDYGHIPNGSRTYYLSRAQPPFFAAMVELQAGEEGLAALVKRLPQLESEYAFWMNGADQAAAGSAFRRVVKLPDGSVLNRYWDDLAIPRDEAYAEDLETARASGRPVAEVYRDLRAAAESGWDFSSRWLEDGRTLATIRTTDFLPVDLNSLLYQLELTIVKACRAAQRPDCVKDLQARSKARSEAIARLFWSEESGAYVDYDWKKQRRSTHLTAATAFPLFTDLADKTRAQRVARTIRERLLQPHGLATTLVDTGQQWDAPNGWAPLQWIAIEGLRRNGEGKLAGEIAERWLRENARVYCQTGKLVEKYNVREAGKGAGGEYPVQDGFGWTNGVVLALLDLYPELAKQKWQFTGGACSASAPTSKG